MAKILEIGLSLPGLLNQDRRDLSLTPSGRDWRLVSLGTVMYSTYRRQWDFQLVPTEFLHDDCPEIHFELEVRVEATRTVISTRQIVEGPSGIRLSPAEIGGLGVVSSAPDFHAELDFFKASYMKHESWISETIKIADESLMQNLLDDEKNIMLDELDGLALKFEISPTDRQEFGFTHLVLEWLGNRGITATGQVRVVDTRAHNFQIALPITLESLLGAEAFERCLNNALDHLGSGKNTTLEALSDSLEIGFQLYIGASGADLVLEWKLKNDDFETSFKISAFLKSLLDEEKGLFAVMSQDFANFADKFQAGLSGP